MGLMLRRRAMMETEAGAYRGYNIKGSPSISDYILQQNNTNYIYTPEPFAPGATDSFYFQTRLVCTDNPYVTPPKTWFAGVTSSGQGQQRLFVVQSYGGPYSVFVGNGSSWNVLSNAQIGSFSSMFNTSVLWRVVFDYNSGTGKYRCYASFPELQDESSGVTFTGAFPATYISFGGGFETSPGLGGTLDLRDTQIVLNNKLWWSAI